MHAAIWKYLYCILLFAFGLQTHAAERENSNFTLVIDAGHGGHDAGAVGAFSKEKDINLKVALAFGRLVEEHCSDVKVIYTRRKDVFIPLQRRADIANNNKADLFISIHTNALAKGQVAYGSETYTLGMARANANLEVARRENSVITLESNYQRTYEGFDPSKAESYVIFEFMQDRYMKQSVELARCIQRQYTSTGRPNKGVHQAGFLVLRNTCMPSVLTELGFITTPAEERYLNSERGITELSRSIYNGFLVYRREHDRRATDLPKNLPTRSAETEKAEETVATSKKRVAVVPVEAKPTEQLVAARDSETAQRTEACLKQETEDGKQQPTNQSEQAPRTDAAKVSRTKERTAVKRKAESTQAATNTQRQQKASAQKDKAAQARPTSTPTKKKTPKVADKTPKVRYHIQVGAGKKQRATNDPQFKGLKIQRVKEGTLYKYHYGNYSTHAEARKALRTVQAKMPEAYIVAYLNGKAVPVAEARGQEKK